MQKEKKFESLILNKIYNTDYFEEDEDEGKENFLKKKKYPSLLENFKQFLKKFHNQELRSEYLSEIIEISQNLIDPDNKNCFFFFSKLNDMVGEEFTFHHSLQTEIKCNNCNNENINHFGFIDVIIFSALYNCKLWANLYRPSKSKLKVENRIKQIEKLSLFFEKFEQAFSDYLLYRFNVSMLSDKHKKKQEKFSRQKKSHPEFISAVHQKNFQSIVEFLNAGISVDSINAKDKKSAAHIACELGDLELCKLLDSYEIDWEAKDQENLTPIFAAVEGGNIEILKFLNTKHVNLEHKDFQERTAFYHACCIGNITIIDFLLKELNCQPDIKSKKGRTPLSKACYLSKPEVVRYLLKNVQQIDINSIDDKGRTPLHNASWGPEGGKQGKILKGVKEKDCPISAELLLDHGAKLECQDNDGNTPFAVASASSAIETMILLWEKGASINSRNKKGETPLFQACKYGHLTVVKILLEKMNAARSIADFTGLTCEETSIENDSLEVFEYLVQGWGVEGLEKVLGCMHREKYVGIYLEWMQKMKIELNYEEKLGEMMGRIEKIDLFFEIYQLFSNIDVRKKEKIFYHLVKNRKSPDFLRRFIEHERKIFDELDTCFNFIVDLWSENEIDFRIIRFFIFETNLDFVNDYGLSFKDEMRHSLLFLLIEKKNVDIILDLLKVFRKEKLSFKMNNKYLRTITTENIKKIILEKDPFYKINSLELAQIRKFPEIYRILNQFCEGFFDNQDNQAVNYHIPNYEIIESTDETQYVHSKKQFLENLNELITENNDLSQYEFLEKENLVKSSSSNITLEALNERKFYFINTEEELIQMTNLLNTYRLIGVDLEYHTEKANVGFISILQLSTIDFDIVIDSMFFNHVIAKHFKKLFENNKIIKIFHGCDSDLQWLKTDYDFDIVNIFDTAKAYMYLSKDKSLVSLAFLAKKYLNINLDKQFQTSDWRIRPLPKFMMEYAKRDSNVLLYLFCYLIEELNESEKIKDMILSSNRYCFEKIEKCRLKKIKLIQKNFKN